MLFLFGVVLLFASSFEDSPAALYDLLRFGFLHAFVIVGVLVFGLHTCLLPYVLFFSFRLCADLKEKDEIDLPQVRPNFCLKLEILKIDQTHHQVLTMTIMCQ